MLLVVQCGVVLARKPGTFSPLKPTAEIEIRMCEPTRKHAKPAAQSQCSCGGFGCNCASLNFYSSVLCHMVRHRLSKQAAESSRSALQQRRKAREQRRKDSAAHGFRKS